VRLPVDVSPVAEGHDNDQEKVILDRVDDPVVTDADPVGRATGKRTGCRWARVLGK
jgi:ribosomal protein L14E/L6E/L27E